jgi:addiction module HigA family antidote
MPMHDPEHPGTVLKTLYLDPLGLTVTEAAKGLCVTRQSLSNIINGHTAITPEMALRLEKAFGTSRQTCLTMQQRYDLWQAEQRTDLSKVRVFTEEISA